MFRESLWLMICVVPLMALVGCSKNEKATEACKDSPTMEACESCCKTNGANGHSGKYIGDTKECSCLGG